jgi:hypothetical protein
MKPYVIQRLTASPIQQEGQGMASDRWLHMKLETAGENITADKGMLICQLLVNNETSSCCLTLPAAGSSIFHAQGMFYLQHLMHLSLSST